MRRWKWIPVLAVAEVALTLWWLPPEAHVGRLLTLIYLHGALVRVAVLFFLLAALTALGTLFLSVQRWRAWTRLAYLHALAFWAAGFLLSVYPAYATWGTPVAWSEPRTRMVIQVLVLGLGVYLVLSQLDDPRWLAAGILVVSGFVPVLIARTGVILHPLNPIGTSPSWTFRALYGLVLLGLAVLGAWSLMWWKQRETLLTEHPYR